MVHLLIASAAIRGPISLLLLAAALAALIAAMSFAGSILGMAFGFVVGLNPDSSYKAGAIGAVCAGVLGLGTGYFLAWQLIRGSTLFFNIPTDVLIYVATGSLAAVLIARIVGTRT